MFDARISPTFLMARAPLRVLHGLVEGLCRRNPAALFSGGLRRRSEPLPDPDNLINSILLPESD